MSIPESVVGAARAPGDFELQNPHAEARARRVILALAEEMPADAVMEATFVLLGAGVSFSPIEGIAVHIRAAIIAALRKMAEE
jgi:hypothetical protein